MKELQIFNSEEFGQIRMMDLDGKLFFMASDIAKALGYSNPNKAVNDHCKAITKCAIPISGKLQEVNFITEGDMYRLITHSKLESAEKFESWVFDEVLPTIRKTGTYFVSTTCQYPISAAALEGATNAGRLLERIMKSEGAYPHEIAMVVKSIFQQAGIEVLDSFVKLPVYEQLTLPLGFSEIVTR